ncbi:MAG: DsbE family thiol:disulfide interchange protein [Paracoccaceae bacterium]|nr:DsbE family thiol:disulfide interchange protein [Paracoccaceae bacterium]
MAKISPMMILPPVIFAGLAAMFWFGMNRSNPDALPSQLVGHEAPAVVLTPLGDGAPFTDATLRDGKVKIVNFWASWCEPCRAEASDLRKMVDKGITIYGVNYKDKPADALGFLASVGDPFAAMGADPAGTMALNWGVYGVPETYVIDGKGKVLLRLPGPIVGNVFDTVVKPALDKAAQD